MAQIIRYWISTFVEMTQRESRDDMGRRGSSSPVTPAKAGAQSLVPLSERPQRRHKELRTPALLSAVIKATAPAKGDTCVSDFT